MQDPAKFRVQELKQQLLKSSLCLFVFFAERSCCGLTHYSNYPSQQAQHGKPHRDKTQALLCPPGLPKQPSQHLQGPPDEQWKLYTYTYPAWRKSDSQRR